MTDESALDTDLRKGRAAERLLAEPVLVEAFDTLAAEYMKKWKATITRDTESRERLWMAIRVLDEVRTHLSHLAAGGKMAQAEIDQVAKMGERKKIFGVV